MEIKRKLAKLSPFFQSAVVIAIAALFVCSIVYAATTIGSSITTAGNLTVTGWASSTSATTTNYLIVGSEFTLPSSFDYTEDLAVSGDAIVAGTVTSTVALWVGTGTADNLDLTGGDLYVQGSAEIDGTSFFTGLLTFGAATGTSATTSSYLMVGKEFTLPPAFDYYEDLAVSGDAVIQGNATTTGNFYLGGPTMDLTTSTATTTAGLFVRVVGNNSTSTIGIGDTNDGTTKVNVGCLELMASDGTHWNCFIDTAQALTAVLVCVAGRCN